ncbi:hypothetical protein VNO77_30908 [Canavalia gladiata]|uniref:Uncharacterized protein n=1 Tax=Canavalia gladiata TaxID=3824 RepID=A0AAN9KRI6_CANGL
MSIGTIDHSLQLNEEDTVSIKDRISSNLTLSATFSRDVTVGFAGMHKSKALPYYSSGSTSMDVQNKIYHDSNTEVKPSDEDLNDGLNSLVNYVQYQERQGYDASLAANDNWSSSYGVNRQQNLDMYIFQTFTKSGDGATIRGNQ